MATRAIAPDLSAPDTPPSAQADGVETTQERIFTALKTLDAVADPDHRFLRGTQTTWPRILLCAGDVLGEEELARERSRLARFRPTPAEVDDMLPALSLIGPREKPFVWLLRLRAYGYSYRQIARLRGRSGEFWRRKIATLITAMMEKNPAGNEKPSCHPCRKSV